MRPELALIYNDDMRPAAGKCSACGEPMPMPPTDPRDNVDAILWLSRHFLIHQQLKHSVLSSTDGAETVEFVTQ